MRTSLARAAGAWEAAPNMGEPEQLNLLDWLAAQPPSPSVCPPMESASPLTDTTSALAPVHLVRVDPACNMRRFYSLALAMSLFGEHGVERRWGRIGTTGQSRTNWHTTPEAAKVDLERVARHKRKRGYQ